MSQGPQPLALVARLLEASGLSAVLIGGHAVNAWVEPRFTADIDLTVRADPAGIAAMRSALLDRGYHVVREVGGGLPSGPDFVRFMGPSEDEPPIDLQPAKTAFQAEVIRRARPGDPPVATPEDLIVLKLIAHRSKDLIDLRSLAALPDLDWAYIERWAAEWEVTDRLAGLRPSP